MRAANILAWFKHPWVVLASVGIGIMIGALFPSWTEALAPIGQMYLSFLKMCVLPIMVTAVVSSFGKLVSGHLSNTCIKRMATVFLSGLLLAGIVGVAIGWIGSPGQGLNRQAQTTLGQILIEQEERSGQAQAEELSMIENFAAMLVPQNIFNALHNENNLQVLFFSIVFGISIGLLATKSSRQIIQGCEAIFKAFEQVISWTMIALPVGLMCIISDNIASTGVSVMTAMLKFIVLIHLAAAVLIAISGMIIWRLSGKRFGSSLTALKEPLIIAFGTRNSYAAMPSLFQSLRYGFRIDPQAIQLIVPLGIVICRYSMVIVFTIGTIFAAELYGVDIGLPAFVLILFGAVLAALAGAGAPAVAAVSMMSLVLDLFGLPSEASIILILASLSVIDPILTVVNIHLSSAAALMIATPVRSDPSRQF